MKKRIFSFSLIVLLTIAMLFGLTACGDDSDSDSEKEKGSSSSAKGTIEAAIDAINDQDASALVKLIDIDSLGNALDENIKSKWLKEGLRDFFDENDDLKIKVSKIKSLKDDDLLDDLLDYYDSYDEYIEYIEDEYDLENVEIYTAKLSISGDNDYDDALDDLDSDGKDIIYLTKKDGEYKIIYTVLSTNLYYEYISPSYDYDSYYTDPTYYEDDDDYYSSSYTSATQFNKVFNSYEGRQSGTDVKEFIDKVIAYTDSEHIIYISYYGVGGTLEELMINSTSDLNKLKNDIISTHTYTVEFEEDYEGYIRYVDVEY